MAITLKAARVNAGLTQKEAAKALNIAKGTLASYEMYRTKPDIEKSKQMAVLYNMTVDDLIFFKPRLCLEHNNEGDESNEGI